MKKYAALAVVLVIVAASPRAQGTRVITEKDLFKFAWIADPQISPDGTTVAFVRVTVNEKENRYETSVYAVASGGAEAPRRLTSGIRDTTPRWAPDGKRIAFVRAPEKDGKPQIFVLHMDGGEARPITDVASGASSPVWSPDGTAIAFNSSTGVDDGRKSGDATASADHKSDVQVVTRAVYRANGNPGLVDNDHHAHIFTIEASESGDRRPPPKQLTDGEFDERGIEWAPDGSQIYFVSTRVAEPYYEERGAELFSVPASGGTITKIAAIDGDIGNLSASPDGRRIAFIGTLRGKPIRSYSQPDLWVVDASPNSTPKNLTEHYDYDVGGGIGGDQSAPRGNNRKPIVWSKDPAASAGQAAWSLIVVTAEKGSANLRRFALATGASETVTSGAQDVVAYSATPDASKIAATLSTQTTIGDIAVVDVARTDGARADGARADGARADGARADGARADGARADGARADGARAFQASASVHQITHVNADLFKDIRQSEPEEIWYKSFDGKTVQGWILKPPDFDATKKYPLILEIHGGPHSAYGNTYTHEFQWMAAKGYVVLFTNPRGSTSYGQDFGNIIQYRYPGDDYKDLMAGVDEVLKKGYVDANRLGVTGGSGGGLLTNWTITQTPRFKAAVAQRDIADWYGFWFTADFTLFQPTWFRKAPWEDPQDFAERSPITHVANVTTPLMLINGDWDYRTPPADGGEMMFRALKYRKIPTVMVRFPRETHELSRSGEPWHRVERLQHIVGWMDQWLQGKKNVAYATQ
jgi:dipeptidyl aminopeptidase/acylaminoacyl peptidase